MRAALIAALLLLAAPARAETSASVRAESPVRLWAGPALALDPVFAAAAGGADWFLSPRASIGFTLAHTIGGAGDQLAAEAGYGFADLLARLRAPLGTRTRLELLGGAGAARIRFGAPGAHTEFAPDVLLGGALGLRLGGRWELGAELQSHVTLGTRGAARNAAHTSELVVVALRWGASLASMND